MSMIDPVHNDGNSVLATQSSGDRNGTSEKKEDQVETTQTTPRNSTELPLVGIKGPKQRSAKLSPTVQYDTDRYRLARPFTTHL